MKKLITWGTPKYIQEDALLEKHQFNDIVPRKTKRSKICKATKGKHAFEEVEPNLSDWWYERWKDGVWKEFRCPCGKKDYWVKPREYWVVS